MRRLRLGNLIVRLRLPGVNEIRELQRVLDEKYRYVVADNIPVTLFSVELDRKAANISHSVSRATATQHCTEAQEDRGVSGCVRQNAGVGVFGKALMHLERSESTSAAGVHDSFWDSLMVEAVDLLTRCMIF